MTSSNIAACISAGRSSIVVGAEAAINKAGRYAERKNNLKNLFNMKFTIFCLESLLSAKFCWHHLYLKIMQFSNFVNF